MVAERRVLDIRQSDTDDDDDTLPAVATLTNGVLLILVASRHLTKLHLSPYIIVNMPNPDKLQELSIMHASLPFWPQESVESMQLKKLTLKQWDPLLETNTQVPNAHHIVIKTRVDTVASLSTLHPPASQSNNEKAHTLFPTPSCKQLTVRFAHCDMMSLNLLNMLTMHAQFYTAVEHVIFENVPYVCDYGLCRRPQHAQLHMSRDDASYHQQQQYPSIPGTRQLCRIEIHGKDMQMSKLKCFDGFVRLNFAALDQLRHLTISYPKTAITLGTIDTCYPLETLTLVTKRPRVLGSLCHIEHVHFPMLTRLSKVQVSAMQKSACNIGRLHVPQSTIDMFISTYPNEQTDRIVRDDA